MRRETEQTTFPLVAVEVVSGPAARVPVWQAGEAGRAVRPLGDPGLHPGLHPAPQPPLCRQQTQGRSRPCCPLGRRRRGGVGGPEPGEEARPLGGEVLLRPRRQHPHVAGVQERTLPSGRLLAL